MEEKKKRVPSEWDGLVKAIQGKHAKKFNDLLETLPEDEFVQVYPKLLEYVVPKLQRVDGNMGLEVDNEIRIVHVTESQSGY